MVSRFIAAIAVMTAPLTLLAVMPSAKVPTGLRFIVKLDPRFGGIKADSGRVLVGISKKGEHPDFTNYKPPVLPILGTDATAFTADWPVVLDASADVFPVASLSNLPAGEYTVQALFLTNRDINLPNAPGNLHSELRTVKLDPAAGTKVELRLDQSFGESVPKDTQTHKYLKIPSKRLSDFHGRPMEYRVAVVLPENFAQEPEKHYGLIVDIGGFGTRYSSAGGIASDPRFVQVVPDGAGPFGDPYQVNSANNGPYGDALTREVLPLIEKAYRCGGDPRRRFTCGMSTGGWVSLALQIFYPEFFNGCWSQCPDSVTFERFELIDLYTDANAFQNSFGFERPSTRTPDGDTVSTVRHEIQLERVLGRGGRWEFSGRDWASWNAVYGPRGKDRRPVPVWDGQTGRIDRAVVDHWKQYDLKRVLEQNWKTLGPKLAGKIHLWVGEADDYYLNAAVHRLKDAVAKWSNPKFDGTITIELGKTHTHGGWSRQERLDAMAKRAGLR